MSKSPEVKTYSARDVAAQLNNALLTASRLEESPIDTARLRKLHDYSAALTSPCKKHVEEGLLSAHELVVVYLSCALMTFAAEHTGAGKLPLVSLAQEVTKKPK